MIGVFDDTILYQIKEPLTTLFNRETLFINAFQEHFSKKMGGCQGRIPKSTAKFQKKLDYLDILDFTKPLIFPACPVIPVRPDSPVSHGYPWLFLKFGGGFRNRKYGEFRSA